MGTCTPGSPPTSAIRPPSKPLCWPWPTRAGRRSALLGQSVQEIHGLQQAARQPEGSEPPLVDLLDLPAPVDSREPAVGNQAEGRLVPPDHEPVGLVGQILVAQPQPPDIARLDGQADEAHAVPRIAARADRVRQT